MSSVDREQTHAASAHVIQFFDASAGVENATIFVRPEEDAPADSEVAEVTTKP